MSEYSITARLRLPHVGSALSPDLFTAEEQPVRPADARFEMILAQALAHQKGGENDLAFEQAAKASEMVAAQPESRRSSCWHKLARVYAILGNFKDALYFCRKAATEFSRDALKVRESDSMQDKFAFVYAAEAQKFLPVLLTEAAILNECRRHAEATRKLEFLCDCYAGAGNLGRYSEALNEVALSVRDGNPILSELLLTESRRLCIMNGSAEEVQTIERSMLDHHVAGYAGQSRPIELNAAQFRNLDLPDLPPDIAVELNVHNRLPNTLGRVRKLLECALIAQYRQIADGLLADMLMRGTEITNLTWWQTYARTLPVADRAAVNLDDAGFLAFRSRFIQKVGAGKIRRVRRTDLHNRTVVVLGGTVRCWEDGRINRQLAALGSDLRLVFVDSDALRLWELAEQCLGDDARLPPPIDARFILGATLPLSALWLAVLFLFEEEHATSPYLPRNTGGFAERTRAVARLEVPRLREIVADRETENSGRELSGTIAHEIGHVQFGLWYPGSARILPIWRQLIREDICRFTRVPRRRKEIAATYGQIYQHSNEDRKGRREAGDMTGEHPQLTEDLQRLCQKGLIKQTPDDILFSEVFDEDSLWDRLAV